MFASSPGLHGIEHAIYDIWLTDCKGGSEVIAEAKEPDDDAGRSTGAPTAGGARRAQPAQQGTPAGAAGRRPARRRAAARRAGAAAPAADPALLPDQPGRAAVAIPIRRHARMSSRACPLPSAPQEPRRR